jgi:hypothetical protein
MLAEKVGERSDGVDALRYGASSFKSSRLSETNTNSMTSAADIHPEILRACQLENIQKFAETLANKVPGLMVMGPMKLTVKKHDGKYSKGSFIGMEVAYMTGIYNGKKTPICVLTPAEKSAFSSIEVPIHDMEAVFGSAVMVHMLNAARSLELPSTDDLEFEAKSKVYDDYGSW